MISRPRSFKAPYLGMVLCVCSSALMATELPDKVEVFTRSPTSITGIEELQKHDITVQVHDLAEVANIEATLSGKLPGNPQDAQAIALRRIERQVDSLSSQLGAAWLPRIRAQQLGISRLPAVVIDGSVLYTNNLVKAVKSWMARNNASPAGGVR